MQMADYRTINKSWKGNYRVFHHKIWWNGSLCVCLPHFFTKSYFFIFSASKLDAPLTCDKMYAYIYINNWQKHEYDITENTDPHCLSSFNKIIYKLLQNMLISVFAPQTALHLDSFSSTKQWTTNDGEMRCTFELQQYKHQIAEVGLIQKNW